MQAKFPTTSKSNKKRTVNALYIGGNDNSTGYYVFKLKTKKKISVPKVALIPML